ncbi:immunoglobulin-like domain-containing protein [Acanthopleuribacter pedis]|uniref:DUF5011 domain-containing protein n=1 Tax=Acanthopleuribacter pedis TaxID=442870 RepID=A0A8J7U5C0_9BACT|nr:immunoglobulin-like domain-containing protein [Acanthopleuribacter pedis]MBO1321572.1 DUF5011 domain-containing protein [Acanthopleuribacter pedis]
MLRLIDASFLLLFFFSLGSGPCLSQNGVAQNTLPSIHTEPHFKQPPDQRGTQGTTFAEGVEVGRITQSVLDEISGIAASRANEGLFWVHNDSGNPQQEHIFAIDASGRGIANYALSNATNVDWEDIAVGPGPEPNKSYVYVGDIGDNGARRDIKTLYRVEEPVVGQTGASLRADVIRLRYPDGRRDAETLLVDPGNGDVYVVSKREQSNRVYRFAAPLRHGTTHTGEEVARINIHWLTAGDIAPDGSRIIIKTTNRNYLWLRDQDEPIGAALSRDPLKIPVRGEPQGEAVAWDALGLDYYTVSERANQPIYFFQGLDGGGDTTPPIITVRGANPMTVALGGVFRDPGAGAVDDTDGDLSAQIRVTGSVDTSRKGRTTLRYDVTDAAGNAAITATRSVEVVAQDDPSGHRTARLRANEQLAAREWLQSENGTYRFKLQGDGNLVLRNRQVGQVRWASGTQGRSGTRMILQRDGNLVLYTAAGQAVWASRTVGSGATHLMLHNNGSLALHAGSRVLWSVNGNPPAKTSWVTLINHGFDPLKTDSPGGAHETLDNVALSGYGTLELKFVFETFGMADHERLFVEARAGRQWHRWETYIQGVEFDNQLEYTATVAVDASTFPFNDQTEIRFRTEGADDTDQIAIKALRLRLR